MSFPYHGDFRWEAERTALAMTDADIEVVAKAIQRHMSLPFVVRKALARAAMAADPRVKRLEDRLAIAETLIRRLPENGDHWNLIQRFWSEP